jgi:large subunit ribosomal protein L30
MLKITLTSGLVAKTETQRKVVRALGLRKYGSSVVHQDSPTIRGMINKISHLLTVTEADAKAETTKSKYTQKAKAEPVATSAS